MDLKDILVRERKKRGWSQEELASKIQVSRQAVSKWETGDALPDLPKLLALADALGLSLDALCGRESPVSSEAAPAETLPETDISAPKRCRWLWPALWGFLAACLLVGGLWIWSQRNVVPAKEAQAASTLPDTFTVSGVGFSGNSDYEVAYQFTPSVSGEGCAYQITFADADGQSFTFEAPCSGGVCVGTAKLAGGWIGYTVTVSVSDGAGSRSLAVACDLHFSKGDASWLPLFRK